MNSPSKSDQEKYVSEQKSSLLRQIRLLIIFYKINTLLSVKRGPRAAFVIKIKKWKYSTRTSLDLLRSIFFD
jgi:hypothetical protein